MPSFSRKTPITSDSREPGIEVLRAPSPKPDAKADLLVAQFFHQQDGNTQEQLTVTLHAQGSAAEELVIQVFPANNQREFYDADKVCLRAILEEACATGCAQEGLKKIESYCAQNSLKLEFSLPCFQGQGAPSYFSLSDGVPSEGGHPQNCGALRVDPRTGFYTGAALNSQAGYDLIQRTLFGEDKRELSGGMVVFFVDFNNMGIADRFARNEVNEFLSIFRAFWRESCCLTHTSGLALRLGGDEFAFIMPDNSAALGCMKDFVRQINLATSGMFNPAARFSSDAGRGRLLDAKRLGPVEQSAREGFVIRKERPGLDIAEKYAWLRLGLKRLRSQYSQLRAPRPFRLKGYRQWLSDGLSHAGADTENLSQLNSAELAFKLLLLGNLGKLGNLPVMSATASAPVRVPPNGGARSLLLAIATAQKDIHLRKLGAAQVVNSPLDIDPKIVLRCAARAQLKAGEAAEKRFEADWLRLRNTAAGPGSLAAAISMSLAHNLSGDPALQDGVLRFDLAASHSISRYLPINEKREINLMYVDIQNFGALNNQLGYQRADKIVGLISDIVKRNIPGAFIIRLNGGGLAVLTLQEPEGAQLRSIEDSANLSLKLLAHDERILAEIEERHVLREWLEDTTSACLDPAGREKSACPALGVKQFRLSIEPRQSIAEILRPVLGV